MIPHILTLSIGEEYEVQGRSIGRLLNRGGCNRTEPFFSHVHSLKSQSVAGQVPARGRETREAGSRRHPLRRVVAYLQDHFHTVCVCRRLQTRSLPVRQRTRQIPGGRNTKWKPMPRAHDRRENRDESERCWQLGDQRKDTAGTAHSRRLDSVPYQASYSVSSSRTCSSEGLDGNKVQPRGY
jgi:hypothetical protein